MRFLIFNVVMGFSLAAASSSFLSAQSISEKKASLKSSDSDLDQETERFLVQLNRETVEIQEQLRKLYEQTLKLYHEHAPPQDYHALLEEINRRKKHINQLEIRWRELTSKNEKSEGYGLWHAPETTLEQLIIDYGSQDYVYLIPPEVGSIKLSINSNLPIPRASWSQMLELILAQNGVGIRTLNPYLRELYLVKQNHSHLRLITNNPQDLVVLPPDERVSFVLSPEPSNVRRTFAFLEKFINPNTTSLQSLGRDIMIMGSVGEIQDLLRLNDFFSHNRGEKDYRLIPVYKLPADEMAKILDMAFDQKEESNGTVAAAQPPRLGRPTGAGAPPRPSSPAEMSGLKIIPLTNMAQALFIVGTREEVRKAEEIVRNVESQIGGARDKIVYWYTVKNSEAEELADVLYRVYSLMITTGTGIEGAAGAGDSDNGPNRNSSFDNMGPNTPLLSPAPPPQREPPPSLYQPEGFYQEGGYIVNPAPAQPRVFESTQANNGRDNFIVDVKTGSIVMVVEADILPKMKELLRKLDIPKKMVQIETLLFEKVLNRENSIGLNLLKIGDAAMNKNLTGAFFNNLFPKDSKGAIPANAGVTEFMFSRKGSDCGVPAFDLVYRFLLNQDDVQINSSPSLLTVNQTPATIAINEDISINTGIFEVETAKGVTLKDAFTRAQYGITISIKPTIHMADCNEIKDPDFDYVTLDTDVTFDTINPSRHADRPDVTRRHITNQVQVPDGDTVILGGLRRKVSSDRRESIPFLGELPGLGKLFSINTTRDSNTEMFIFITPHIVKDPKEQLTCLRQELLSLRPGDTPYFLECVEEAHQYEKTRLMEGSMTLLFGRPRDHYYISSQPSTGCENSCYAGEYDGR